MKAPLGKGALKGTAATQTAEQMQLIRALQS